jgi:hydroxymethylbilane synthase
LIFRGGSSLDSLPSGATVGTASVRRQWQLYHHRPDLRTVLMRGNVLTRLEKMDGGEVDATFLAVAGLERLGIDPVAYHPLSTSTMLPAVAQGAIGIQTLESDGMVRGYVAAIHDSLTGEAVGAERALMWLLSGSCTTPMAGLATMVGDQWCLEGWLADPETGRQSRQLVSWRVGSGDEAASIESLAENLRRAVFV